MRVTLMHNPTSGEQRHPREELLSVLNAAGHEASYQSTDEDEWEQSLDDPGDLVVVAGGDGTVDKVAPHLKCRGIPLAIFPLGTANNVASACGIRGTPAEIVESWQNGHERYFDLGHAAGPWGEIDFLEAAGVGLFARMMPVIAAVGKRRTWSDNRERLRHDLELLAAVLDECRAIPWQVTLDGRDVSGEYVMVEVMNISWLGPGIPLAPDADPGDGQLDIVLVEGDQRGALKEYLDAVQCGAQPLPFPCPVRQAQDVVIGWDGSEVHVDSHLWSDGRSLLADVERASELAPALLRFGLEKHALKVLVGR